jgi:hypothetical protein
MLRSVLRFFGSDTVKDGSWLALNNVEKNWLG